MRVEFVACALAMVGCATVDYRDADGSGGGADTNSGASSTTTSATGSTSASASSSAAGEPACTPTTETCNGLDDDCDGTADEPDTGVGEACGCTWTTRTGRLYAQCPPAADLKSSCPGGLRAVVLETDDERAYVESLLLAAQTANGTTTARIGLAQAPKANDPVEGWAWIGAEGMAIPWEGGEPRDDGDPQGDVEPIPIENHTQDCAALVASSEGVVTFRDVACGTSPMSIVVCEFDGSTCVDGAPCQRAQGCIGTFDCALPELSRCVGVPEPEVCDGLDNDCDGLVDSSPNGMHACQCANVEAGGTTYRVCEKNQVVPHCGPGYRPTLPASASASTALFDQLGSTAYRLDAYQPQLALIANQDWRRFDGTPLTTLYWGADEPDEMLPVLLQQCLSLTSAGWSDWWCDQALPYVCAIAP